MQLKKKNLILIYFSNFHVLQYQKSQLKRIIAFKLFQRNKNWHIILFIHYILNPILNIFEEPDRFIRVLK